MDIGKLKKLAGWLYVTNEPTTKIVKKNLYQIIKI